MQLQEAEGPAWFCTGGLQSRADGLISSEVLHGGVSRGGVLVDAGVVLGRYSSGQWSGRWVRAEVL